MALSGETLSTLQAGKSLKVNNLLVKVETAWVWAAGPAEEQRAANIYKWNTAQQGRVSFSACQLLLTEEPQLWERCTWSPPDKPRQPRQSG